MKNIFLGLAVAFLGSVLCQNLSAQGQAVPSDGHKVLQKDIGTWHADGKMWMPGSDEPMPFEGTEVNEMLGELHLVSNFSGDFGGMEFKGHGTFSFDPDSGTYVGTWIDVTNPYMMTSKGKYDASGKTMTTHNVGKDAMGTEFKGKSTVVYKDENTRVMTMYRAGEGDDWVKEMEITYTKK
jgi:Protein of unknown function (DUF1579)